MVLNESKFQCCFTWVGGHVVWSLVFLFYFSRFATVAILFLLVYWKGFHTYLLSNFLFPYYPIPCKNLQVLKVALHFRLMSWKGIIKNEVDGSKLIVLFVPALRHYRAIDIKRNTICISHYTCLLNTRFKFFGCGLLQVSVDVAILLQVFLFSKRRARQATKTLRAATRVISKAGIV